MIVSDSRRPMISSRGQPKVDSACAFQDTMRPSESMPMKRVVRRVQHQPRPRLALRQVLHGLPPIGVGQRDDDEVGEREGEVLLVERPRPRAADVLDAQHAEGPVFLPQRHVEHRADAVRRQVPLR